MGFCYSSTLYKFDNFITIQNRLPKPKKGTNISKFQFQIHPFSTSYIHQHIDKDYNSDLQAEESFLFTDNGGMKVFEKEQELITKRDKISDCLKTAIIGKICGESGVDVRNVVVFVEPQGRQQYKRIIFNIIVETLIDMDLTCYNEGRGNFGVYFDWPLFRQSQKGKSLLPLIEQVHRRNQLMDNSVVK